jgi:hypothetical protein
MNQGSSVCIGTKPRAGRPKYGASISYRGKKFFSSPRRPDRLWDPFALLSNGYQGLFPLG